jgi:uncharacterized ferritin-like protein (DUF455 family)
VIASLQRAALAALAATDPATKLALTAQAAEQWRAGALALSHDGAVLPDEPGRPARPRLVAPRAVPRRGLGTPEGRAALAHAVAHIEFNAINLAWDAVARFGGLPRAYYDDWVACADDEARHFRMLESRLAELGYRYGDFDAHDALWRAARETAHDCLARHECHPREAVVRRFARLRSAGDAATAAILDVILREEVAHVAAGSRWFEYLCRERGLDPAETFVALLAERGRGALRAPFNRPARRAAGFADVELDALERIAATEDGAVP